VSEIPPWVLPFAHVHNYCFGFYFLRDLLADGLEFGVGWVGVVFEEVGASCVGVSDVFVANVLSFQKGS
jgi:hypothetical protein